MPKANPHVILLDISNILREDYFKPYKALRKRHTRFSMSKTTLPGVSFFLYEDDHEVKYSWYQTNAKGKGRE